MLRLSVPELQKLSQDELKEKITNAKGGRLLDNNTVVADDKGSIVKLYEEVLNFLVNKKGVDITKGLGSTWNKDGSKINTTSNMKKIRDTEIYVDTKTNSYTKFQKMLNCFGELQKKESIDSYIFEIEFEIKKDESSMTSQGREDKKMVNIDEAVRSAIENNKQIIFTGAPGTGKTYSVREYVKKFSANQSKFVQFHPSYDYSDFVEGLRPVNLLGKKEPTFVRLDGTFKEFCRRIVEENLKDAYGKDAWTGMSVDDKYDVMEKLYEKLKNKSEKDEEENEEENKNLAEYKFSHNGKKYFFVVDEINRADLSKVFGELMFGLEESYRGLSNRFDTQYKNLCTYRIIEIKDVGSPINGTTIKTENIGQAIPLEFDCFKNGFFIPENLYFIGTMNDIDRSVDSMDFALRRRFEWVDIKANEVMIESLRNMHKGIGNIEDIGRKIIDMNEVITKNEKLGLSDAYHIGPAYFKNLDGSDLDKSLKDIFEHKIVSILKEYTRGRKNDDINNLLKDCANALGVD